MMSSWLGRMDGSSVRGSLWILSMMSSAAAATEGRKGWGRVWGGMV